MMAVVASIFCALAAAILALHRYHGYSVYSQPATSVVVSAASYVPPAGTAAATGTPANPTATNAATQSTAPTVDKTTSTSSSGVSVPADCFKPNGVPVGWLPDGVDILTIQNTSKSGTLPCTYGYYVQISSSSDYGHNQGSASKSASAGTVYTISLQPWIPFNQDDASKVADAMNTILASGPSVVWLRFAHEMNWYISTNTKNKATHYTGSTDDFKTLWKNIATTVDRSKVKMFWSPNTPVPPNTVTSIGTDWWPGPEYVDIVGLDVYAQSESTTFADAFGDFYDTYAAPNNLPFVLGETGWLAGGTDEQKKYWLGQVSSEAALERCPNYLGFSWFEYDKPSEGDFRVVMGSSNLAASVLG